jgi:hypothetical protein
LWTSVLAQEQTTGFFKATANLATSTPLGVYSARIVATYQGNEVQTNLAFKVLQAPSDYPPSVTVDVPGIVKPNETFVITGFVKSKSGVPINCDSTALITIRDLIAQSDVISNAQMSNFATGRYSYAWLTATSSNYLAMVSCTVSGSSYLGVEEFSSQNIEPDALFIRTSVGSSYIPGETVNVFSTVNNGVGEAVSATTTIEVYKPDGTLLTSGTSTEQYPGFYKFTFTLPTSTPIGTYEVRSKAQTATKIAYDTDAFVVGEEVRELRIISSVGALYIPGETVNVYSTVYDAHNNLVSATVTVEVYKPDGTLLTSGTSTEQTIGFFKFSFELATSTPLGTYEVRTKASYQGKEAYHIISFEVQKFSSSDWTVVVSDVGEVMASKPYRAKVWILDYQSQPTDPYTTPKITIYDANRNKVVDSVSMTKIDIGIYEYTYVVPSNAAQGTWETVVDVEVEPGKIIQGNDYWEVEGSPAQVKINAITDNTVPTITANVTITNEGSANYEYHYEYCIVDSQDNQCNGGDDIDYGMGAKLIAAGQSWTTDLTLNVPSPGTYWFKVYVYWGTERSTAVQQFNAVSEVTYTLTVSKAGTGSGTVTSNPPGISCGNACTASYVSGTVVYLTAQPASNSEFAGWSGACSGTGTCMVTMNANKTVTATFNLKAPPPGGGGGGLPPATIVSFQGKAYPLADIHILKDGQEIMVIKANNLGEFSIDLTNIQPGTYTFSLWAQDTNGLKSVTTSFTVNVYKDKTITISNILLPPTITLSKVTVNKGEIIIISGQATPKSKIEIYLGTSLIAKVTVPDNGQWTYNLATKDLARGTYSIKARAVSVEGWTSIFTQSLTFGVDVEIPTVCKGPDLNFDGRVDLVDFSILLYWWQKKPTVPCVDINNDGIVDLTDFSIMMYWWTG